MANKFLLKRSKSNENLTQINYINDLENFLDDDINQHFTRSKNKKTSKLQELNEKFKENLNNQDNWKLKEIIFKYENEVHFKTNQNYTKFKVSVNSNKAQLLPKELKQITKTKAKDCDEDLNKIEVQRKKIKFNTEYAQEPVSLSSDKEEEKFIKCTSFDNMVKFFEAIANEPFLYETSVERQILKYKLRKMEALYCLSDSERMRIKEMFFDKVPDLVLIVLLESPNYLLKFYN